LEERLQLAVFIDFDNIEIGVKTTTSTELDLSLILEALKERGEVVSKSAYGDWARAGMHSRTLTDHAVHMVQRNVTPRGDKNGADINLVVDALEMAFTRPHITGFAIVGGDSDFIALVEKLKQFGKRVLVVGGRSFTSGVLQRNCHEFISYENLLSASRSSRGGSQSQGRGPTSGRLPLGQGAEKAQRALKILSDRGTEPQLGPLKSTLLQLDSTFSERDYGASSFREFVQKLADQNFLVLRRVDQGYRVELPADGAPLPVVPAPSAPAPAREAAPAAPRGRGRRPAAPADGEEAASAPVAPVAAPATSEAPSGEASALPVAAVSRRPEEAMELLRQVVDRVCESRGGKPIYVRHLAQGLRAADPDFDEQAFGFRTLTELAHLGQREGILRMQRDRQGAWRISSLAQGANGAAGELMPTSATSEEDGSSASSSADRDREEEAHAPAEEAGEQDDGGSVPTESADAEAKPATPRRRGGRSRARAGATPVEGEAKPARARAPRSATPRAAKPEAAASTESKPRTRAAGSRRKPQADPA